MNTTNKSTFITVIIHYGKCHTVVVSPVSTNKKVNKIIAIEPSKIIYTPNRFLGMVQ